MDAVADGLSLFFVPDTVELLRRLIAIHPGQGHAGYCYSWQNQPGGFYVESQSNRLKKWYDQQEHRPNDRSDPQARCAFLARDSLLHNFIIRGIGEKSRYYPSPYCNPLKNVCTTSWT